MPSKPRMLVIEDEEPIARGLADVFTYGGFEVDVEMDGPAGLKRAQTYRYHMILLDIMLPGMDGFEICNRIRSSDRTQPIILLTARTSDEDIIKGLSLGADDYVTKPFSIAELKARVDAVLRRSEGFLKDTGVFAIGDLEIDPKSLEGRRGREVIPFTRREIEILLYLKAHSARPVSRNELLKEIWGYKNVELMETRTVDIHVTKLRRKIEADPANPRLLVTVRGEGYRLQLDE